MGSYQIDMKKPQQAVILCGGMGTRLQPFTKTIPKPMILCNKKPFLWYLLHQLHEQGITRFVLLTGYLGEKIKSYFGNGSAWGWQIEYSFGPVEWNTGKRIWEAKDLLDSCFLLLYSDNFVMFSLDKLFATHQKNNKSLTFMVSRKTPGNVRLDASGVVDKYENNRASNFLDYVEIGYMIVEKQKTMSFYDSADCSFSLVLEKMSEQKEVNSYIQHDMYHSISDPKRWKIAEEYLKPKKIILIDRDGVINNKAPSGEYIAKWENFTFVKDTYDAMKYLAKEGFKFIVITNQAGVARGMVKFDELDRIHKNMVDEFKKGDIEILDVYICEHHWDQGCFCRKPSPGMLFQASKEHSFRLDQTVFIGDDTRDCQASENAGCSSIFIGKVNELKNLERKEQPIYSSTSLSGAINVIIDFFSALPNYKIT